MGLSRPSIRRFGLGSSRIGPASVRSGKPKKVAWRPQSYGDRVLVFDTETTTDAAQRLLFGFFRLYQGDRLIEEGLIVTDLLDYEQMTTLTEYAVKCRLADLQPRTVRGRTVFYPEVYCEGTVCVGFQPTVRPYAH